jgi:peptide/nickel transport system permease protein
MGLRDYVVKRTLLMIPMVFVLLTIVFVLLRALPGDPVTMLEGKDIPEEVLARRRAELGLDQPLHVQYLNYIASVLRGDLGYTALERIPVAEYIAMRLPATVELALAASLLSIMIGVALGVLASFYQTKTTLPVVKVYSSVTFAIPVFYLGLLLQATLGVGAGLFPTGGRLSALNEVELSPRPTGFVVLDALLTGKPWIVVDFLYHLALPSLTLGIYLSSVFARVTYLTLAEVTSQDYFTAGRSRGLTKAMLVWRYGMRNAMIPLVTMAGLQVAALLGGAVLTETVFNWPGIGYLVYEGILKRDYALVQGAVTIYAIIVAVVNLVVDVVYAYIDPRIRY